MSVICFELRQIKLRAPKPKQATPKETQLLTKTTFLLLEVSTPLKRQLLYNLYA